MGGRAAPPEKFTGTAVSSRSAGARARPEDENRTRGTEVPADSAEIQVRVAHTVRGAGLYGMSVCRDKDDLGSRASQKVGNIRIK